MADLQLAVKGEYFRQMQSGEKKFEYRLFNEFWKKRLVNRHYDRLIITLGYPKKGDMSRTLIFPYRGYNVETITHKHFGNVPEKVFSIILEEQVPAYINIYQKQKELYSFGS